MAATTFGNGIVTFPDATVQSTAGVEFGNFLQCIPEVTNTAINTTYTNSTGKSQYWFVRVTNTYNGLGALTANFIVNGNTISSNTIIYNVPGFFTWVGGLVKAGETYQVQASEYLARGTPTAAWLKYLSEN